MESIINSFDLKDFLAMKRVPENVLLQHSDHILFCFFVRY